MANWLADPVACAVRLKTEHGCAILQSRGETMGRTTDVVRTETPKGALYEHGHLFVRTEGKPGQDRTMYAGVRSEGHAVETPALAPTDAYVMSDLLRAAYANTNGSRCGGKSLYDLFWEEMMVVTERLMTGQAAEDDGGAARTLAWVIAVMQNPYRPNVDDVRDQVMDRWEREQAEPEPEPVLPTPAPTRRSPAERRAARARRKG